MVDAHRLWCRHCGGSYLLRLWRAGSELLYVALCELAKELVVEVVEAFAHFFVDTVLVRLQRKTNVLRETLPEVLGGTPCFDFFFVIKLNLAN